MTTCRSKAAFAALALIVMAGCDEVATGGAVGKAPRPALQQAGMAGGAVTLVAPAGFCIDRANLKAQFAVLARCDALGAETTDGGAPIGVISVSLAPAGPLTAPPTPDQIAAANGLGKPGNASHSETLSLFRAEGPSLVDGMSDTQWRAAAMIGTYLLGATLYGPEGGRAVTAEGSDVLKDMITRTRRQTKAN